MKQRETREHQPAQAAQLFARDARGAALVLDNTGRSKRFTVAAWDALRLKSASFPGAHFRAVAEAQVREPPTEGQDVLSKRAAEVGGMAPGVVAAKVAGFISRSASRIPVGLQIRRGASTAMTALPFRVRS